MQYKLVLFDFDGTLADSGAWFLRVINELAEEHGFRRIESHQEQLIRGFSAREVIQHLQVPAWKLPMIMAQTRKRAATDCQSIQLFPGVREMLQALSAAGVKTGIVSSNAEPTIRKILGRSGATVDYFSCGASLFGKAEKLRTLLHHAGFAAAECIYVGDEIRDATAARNLGIAFGAVAWGYTTLQALDQQKPALRFNDISEITRKFGGI